MRPVMVCLAFALGMVVVKAAAEDVPPAVDGQFGRGSSAVDAYPGGCTDCHIDMPEIGVDARFRVALRQWLREVPPELVATVQGVMPEGTLLEGRHPPAERSLSNIPADCLDCHRLTAPAAPPFAAMMHVIHYSGAANHFRVNYAGQCTHCHKLDLRKGTWSMPSGPER